MTDKTKARPIGVLLGVAAGGLLGFAIMDLIPGEQDVWTKLAFVWGWQLFGVLLGRLVDK